MKQITFRTLAVLGSCMAAMSFASFASAQSIHHDKMDAKAAMKDIRRLQADKAMARRNHDWKKVEQDQRLIDADRHFVRKDVRKVIRAGG